MESNSLKSRIQARESNSSKEFWIDYFSLLKEERQSAIIPPEVTAIKENDRYYYSRFSEKTSTDIDDLVRGSERRLFYFLMAILTIIIRKASTSKITSFIVPNFDVDSMELNEVILFIQKIANKLTFRQLLIQIADSYNSIEHNLQYPLDDFFLGEKVDVRQNADYSLVLENLVSDNHRPQENVTGLYFHKNESDHQISLKISYNEAHHSANTIDSFFTSFEKVVTTVLIDIDIEIDEISLTSLQAQDQLINKFQRFIDYPLKTIHQIFEEVAFVFSENVALVINEDSLTYSRLNAKANQLAAYLRKKGVKPDVLTGLLIEPSFDAIIAMLGILKAGGAYLPIDATYPEKRIQG